MIAWAIFFMLGALILVCLTFSYAALALSLIFLAAGVLAATTVVFRK